MMKLPQLSPIIYHDTAQKVHLKCFADTFVYRKQNGKRTLVAMRFGGYPEQVRGMSDALYGGITFEAEVEKHIIPIHTLLKQYRRKLSHDGVYAEAMLIAMDDEKNETNGEENDNKNQKQKSFIFCAKNDRRALFEEIDKKVSVPLILEFQDYVIDELIKSKMLLELEVLSVGQSFDAYMLEMRNDEQDIIEIVNRGLASGAISIPNADTSANAFENIQS
ncbi:MAG: hypothetical protein ACI4A5_06520, partial [Hominilimicola sp.]